MKIRLTSILFCLLPLTTPAQTTPPSQWHHLDPVADKTMGISTDRAYELLKTLPHQPVKPVIVAVIDGGIDLNHDDLKSVLWTNPREVARNGQDDDRNGYVDDVYGWNFLGSKDGRNLEREQKEETRLYARLQPLYERKDGTAIDRASLTPAQQKEYDLWLIVKPYFEKRRAEAEKEYKDDLTYLTEDRANLETLKKAFGQSRLDSALLHKPPTTDTTLLRLARQYYRPLARLGFPNADSLLAYFERFNAERKARIDGDYNLTFNARTLVGDNPADVTERNYGNPDLTTPLTGRGTQHGTHVAGIIAADRVNGLGVKGIADHAQIMFIRAAPDGDERDKDVANAIRYAVDNGAKIISMSWGKYFSPEKIVVDDAMRYADTKGVLLVHAAGNDNLDLDSAQQYPAPTYLNGQTIPNLITVGASDRNNDSTLTASFSNYGQHSVDVFAPGVQIWSCGPGSTYRPSSGTSMATPVVTGIAVVLKTYFPRLSPADLKRIILKSAVTYHTLVQKPGTKQKVDFATLSKTGGIVNLYEAVRLAMAEQTTSAKK